MTATYKETLVYQQEIDACHCNQCGGSLKQREDGLDSIVGLIEQTYVGGWYSSPLNDTTHYKFSLCEICLAKMFLNFKTPPEISGMYKISGMDKDDDWEDEKQIILDRLKKCTR